MQLAIGSQPIAFFTTVGDFNGDQKLDLISVSSSGAEFDLWLGDGRGQFAIAGSIMASGGITAIAAGDFNGDQKLDLITASTNSVSVSLGDGTGQFAPVGSFAVGPSTQGRAVAIRDFDGDGNQDLAVTNNDSDSISILLGDGRGSFAAAKNFAVGLSSSMPNSVAVGDFNQDQKQDLVVVNGGNSSISVLFGDGRGNFTMAKNIPMNPAPGLVLVADAKGN